MTLTEMETLLRDYLDNPSVNSLTQARAFSFLNKSYQYLYNLIVKNNMDFFATTALVNLVSGTERYTLPTASRTVLFERTDQEREYVVPMIPYKERCRHLLADDVAPDGYGSHVYILGNQFGIVPIIRSNIANAIRVTYVPPVTDLIAGTSPPTEWPNDQQEVIVTGALLRIGVRDREERVLRQKLYEEQKLALLEHTSIRQTQETKYFEEQADGEYGW